MAGIAVPINALAGTCQDLGAIIVGQMTPAGTEIEPVSILIAGRAAGFEALDGDQERSYGYLHQGVLWPGAGQSYLHRGGVHWLMGIAGYGLAAGAFYEYNKYYNIDYDNAILQNKDRSMQLTFIISAAAVWASNLVWTILTPSEKEKYQKLNLTFGYNNQIDSKEIGLRMRF